MCLPLSLGGKGGTKARANMPGCLSKLGIRWPLRTDLILHQGLKYQFGGDGERRRRDHRGVIQSCSKDAGTIWSGCAVYLDWVPYCSCQDSISDFYCLWMHTRTNLQAFFGYNNSSILDWRDNLFMHSAFTRRVMHTNTRTCTQHFICWDGCYLG